MIDSHKNLKKGFQNAYTAQTITIGSLLKYINHEPIDLFDVFVYK